MRRRSGAFHCDSEEDFMELAQAAHNEIGIFYDEKANKKVMHQIKSHQINTQSFIHHQLPNPQYSEQKINIDYSGFEFGLQSEADQQERLELQRSNEQINHSQSIVLICQSIVGVVQKLFGVKDWDTINLKSTINMFQKRIDHQIIKFWMLDRIKLQNGDQILNLYLRKSNIVLNFINNQIIVARNSSIMTDDQILSFFTNMRDN